MWDSMLVELTDYSFWTFVLVACMLWYALSCFFTRYTCLKGTPRGPITRESSLLALFFVIPAMCIGVVCVVGDIILAIMLGAATFILPTLFMLVFLHMKCGQQ